MVKNPLYGAMLGCQQVTYEPLTIEGDTARQVVTLLSAEYEEVQYLFVLSQQSDAPYK